MTMFSEERLSDSPYVEKVMRGWMVSDGWSLRPAECHWHLVLVRHEGRVQPIAVGPLTTAGIASWGEGAEIFWIKFKLGTFFPQLPPKRLLNGETILPDASSRSFWLHGSAWQFPNYENADTFVERLVRNDALRFDPVVRAALQDQSLPLSSRTVRQRFLQTTGMSQTYIRQMARAQQAAACLQQGLSILDTVYELGYFDQPHLTRSLKQFIGQSPAQIIRTRQTDEQLVAK